MALLRSRHTPVARALCVCRVAVFVEEAEALIQQHGLQLAHLQDMLEQYAELNLIDVNPSRTRIDFVVAE
jgi:hypothetical protein